MVCSWLPVPHAVLRSSYCLVPAMDRLVHTSLLLETPNQQPDRLFCEDDGVLKLDGTPSQTRHTCCSRPVACGYHLLPSPSTAADCPCTNTACRSCINFDKYICSHLLLSNFLLTVVLYRALTNLSTLSETCLPADPDQRLLAYHLQLASCVHGRLCHTVLAAKKRLAVAFSVLSLITDCGIVVLPLAYTVSSWGMLTATSKALMLAVLCCVVPEHVVAACTMWGIYRLNGDRVRKASQAAVPVPAKDADVAVMVSDRRLWHVPALLRCCVWAKPHPVKWDPPPGLGSKVLCEGPPVAARCPALHCVSSDAQTLSKACIPARRAFTIKHGRCCCQVAPHCLAHAVYQRSPWPLALLG